jgi:hypothetical protein
MDELFPVPAAAIADVLTAPPSAEARPEAQRSLLKFVPYLYLLRVQGLTALLLCVALPLSALTPLFRGLFDLDYGAPWHTILGTALATLAAFATAWTLMATTWAAAFNAPARFDVARIRRIKYPITWPDREAFAVSALPVVLTLVFFTHAKSQVSVWTLLAGVVIGLGVAVGALVIARTSAERLETAVKDPRCQTRVARLVRVVARWLDRDNVREGFLKGGELTPGHLLAAMVFTFCAVLYMVIGAGKAWRLGYEAYVSTLTCVLLLVTLLCWLLSGLTFFLDRYRVSTFLLLGIVAFAVNTIVPGGDYDYKTAPQLHDDSPRPMDVLKGGSRTPIIIAATGGGIQAAAWAARVLTGIDEAMPTADLKDAYTHSIRLFSTVSGGGVGTMYFAQRYGERGFDRTSLHSVMDEAEASSLDDVAWGAVYPDAWATFVPPLRRVFGDRGQALERAWTARNKDVASRLSAWRTQVWGDQRPANIFNATLVDSGERLLIGTSRLGWTEENPRGLQNFEELHPQRDLQVVTAARLAASFTYVSPATRRDGAGAAPHVVDGGYYDDYGMTTLMEWIDEGLRGVGGANTFHRVMVIQIRSEPGDRTPHVDGWDGPLYQLLAPFETLLNVRSTGQISHNDEQLDLLQGVWKAQHVAVDNVVFRFCGDHPPLSWHMTRSEKDAIEDGWSVYMRDGAAIRAIAEFIARAKANEHDPTVEKEGEPDREPHNIQIPLCQAPSQP